MLNLQKYQNKKIAIYGMGVTGCSAASTFRKLKTKIYCWDDNKKIRNKLKNLNYNLEKFWLLNDEVDNIVISPGVDINKCRIKKYLKKNSNKIITDIDIFFEKNKNALIISITGTNGKSTTCKIIEKILKCAKYNVKTLGNIGTPILSENFDKKKYAFILEVSSYQLQYSKIFRSKHAAILNISPDHLERHKNIKNYTQIKSRIFYAQNSSDYSYINLKNKYTNLIKKEFKNKKLTSKLIHIDKSNLNKIISKIKNTYFNSHGNVENLAFAYKICKNLGISDKIIIKAANDFISLPHRQETVIENKKFICVNDSKATSFDACSQSLSNYENIYWIVGGLPKLKDKFLLEKYKKKIIKAYIIGKNITFFEKKIKREIPYKVSLDIKNAINDIYRDFKLSNFSKKTILFSPAAASFDQFENFENRGMYFKKLIIEKFI